MSGRAQRITAIGKGPSQLLIASGAVRAKDQTGHTQLKFRQTGSSSSAAAAASQGEETVPTKTAAVIDEEKNVDVSALLQKSSAQTELNAEVLKKYDDSDALRDSDSDDDEPKTTAPGSSSSSGGAQRKENSVGSDEDEDDDDDDNVDVDEDDDDDDDDDEDDELALHAELERIKAERAAAAAKREQEERELRENQMRDGAMKSNPLVDLSSSNGGSKIKRAWNDDVVFRNQARDEPEVKRRFINDTTRSDFHRSFLKRFVR
jgi:protein CWC15